jgi:hypothetical protein
MGKKKSKDDSTLLQKMYITMKKVRAELIQREKTIRHLEGIIKKLQQDLELERDNRKHWYEKATDLMSELVVTRENLRHAEDRRDFFKRNLLEYKKTREADITVKEIKSENHT